MKKRKKKKGLCDSERVNVSLCGMNEEITSKSVKILSKR